MLTVGWFGLISSATTAVVVGFASTILLIMEAARAVGATPAQQASWAAALCLGMAVTSFYLSWRYKMPIITAWSTPGAVLSSPPVRQVSAIRTRWAPSWWPGCSWWWRDSSSRWKRRSRRSRAGRRGHAGRRAAALYAGRSGRRPGHAHVRAAAGHRLLRSAAVIAPLYAVPVVVALGVAMAAFGGGFAGDCCSFGLTALEWTTPAFDWQTILSIGVPLFLVTMASQNLPGFAVLRASGYQPPVQPALVVTGAASAAAGALRQPCHQHGGDHGLDRDRPRLPPGPGKALARGLALSRPLRR